MQMSYIDQFFFSHLSHAIGALIHTRAERGKKAHVYLDLLQYPHDSNLTANILLDILTNHCASEGHIPNILYLQLDNCFRENKNKYVF